MSVAPGTSLGGYAILESIGAGGMGEVYRARDQRLGRDVAIKILPHGTRLDSAAHSRFEREARAAAALNHPHIVTIHEIGTSGDLDFIVMELVIGRRLDQVIAGQGLPIDRLVDYARQIAGALEAAHAANIVHRDIKPSNIMVTDAGQVKVLDFGLAKPAAGTPTDAQTATAPLATRIGEIVGTVAYMSPEQVEGRPLDVSSDVFSFGAVLYEMCTGRRAFAGDTAVGTLARLLAPDPEPVRTIRLGVPPDLARLVSDCLQRDRTARPTAAEIGGRLAAQASGTIIMPRARSRWAKGLAVAAVIAAIAFGGWLVKRRADARWIESTFIPEIQQLIRDDRTFDAFVRFREAGIDVSARPTLASLWQQVSSLGTVRTDPPGADVAVASYDAEAPQWTTIGQTPLNSVALPAGVIRIRVTKPGYVGTDDVALTRFFQSLGLPLIDRKLIPVEDVPQGLVRAYGPKQPVPFYLSPGADPVDVQFPDYWIGRYEVTNREYRKFVDAGGYQRAEFWTEPFIDQGRTLSLNEAMARFRDATGRPGPATWQAGAYPDGQDDWPVAGVSWYEAQAYLKFAGRQMPTLPHWQNAAGFNTISRVLSVANFKGAPVRVGSVHATTRFGTEDLAGNVKEWLSTSAGGGLRYIVGGGFDEPQYMFTEPDARPPFERAANFGVRAALFDEGDRSPATIGAEVIRPERDYSRERPVSDAVFGAFHGYFAYDRTPVNATLVETDDSHPDWRRDTVTFPAAYPGETVTVYLFLPKRTTPPYQTLVFLPGAEQFVVRSSRELRNSPPFAHIVRSGRAVAMPIVKGAFERGTSEFSSSISKEGLVWRDYLVAIEKDLARTLDYLETRPDIDVGRMGYVGNSRGAAIAPIVLALEPERLKTAVLMLPGLYLARPKPEVDVFNYLPRVRQPVLMLSGRYDFIFVERRSQVPFFEGLGTPAADKRHVSYDSGHNIPIADMIKESLDWLDRTLGTVAR